MQQSLTTRFRLFLDPTSPRIELLPTSKTQAAAGNAKGGGGGGADAKKDSGGGKGKEAAKPGEMYVVKRGWLGGWSVTPATQEVGWMSRIERRTKEGVREWIMGWPSDAPLAAA